MEKGGVFMETEFYRPIHKIRFVTASSLFDGHDASINIFRRLLQAAGTEVIHLGHNRSAEEVVNAAIDEDVQGIALSSYQGGHMEYFKYVYDLLQEKGAGHIRIFGGGGGVIVQEEIQELERYGIAKIFSPEDGRRLGLIGMVNHMLKETDFSTSQISAIELEDLQQQRHLAIARMITLVENSYSQENQKTYELRWKKEIKRLANRNVPVIGITGTGGAGKSSLTDELVRRFLQDFPDKSIAILSVDPSKQKTGGALLGDRIRMNSIHHPQVYVRSLATRGSRTEISLALKDAIEILKTANFDLIFVETSGIGQGNTEVTSISDLSVYVMSSDYGAPSQLEKIDMLDFADLIVINKFDRKGSEDALRDVRKQYQRNHQLFDRALEDLPVYGTIANRFNHAGVNRFYQDLIAKVIEKNQLDWKLDSKVRLHESKNQQIIPPQRESYLYEIVNTVRQYQQFTIQQVDWLDNSIN